jgi:hypothetical protein
MMKNLAALVVCLALTLSAGLLTADTSFRCGSDLIEVGYTMYQVKNSCGTPDSEQVTGSSEASGGAVKRLPRRGVVGEGCSDVTLNITEWIYNRDSGLYILTFEGDKLVRKEFKNE